MENVHHLRLMALLKDMVRELGPVEAAEALGIDRKTVWRGLSAGRLSPRLSDALERLLLEEGVADSARQLGANRGAGAPGGGDGRRRGVRWRRLCARESTPFRGEVESLGAQGLHGAAKPANRWSGLDTLRRRAGAVAGRVGGVRERRGSRTVERMLDPAVVTSDSRPRATRRCTAKRGPWWTSGGHWNCGARTARS